MAVLVADVQRIREHLYDVHRRVPHLLGVVHDEAGAILLGPPTLYGDLAAVRSQNGSEGRFAKAVPELGEVRTPPQATAELGKALPTSSQALAALRQTPGHPGQSVAKATPGLW